MPKQQASVQKQQKGHPTPANQRPAPKATVVASSGLLALQDQIGNRAVQRWLVQRKMQHLAQSEDALTNVSVVAYDKEELARAATLPGHAASWMIARQSAGAAQPLSVNLTLVVKAPHEVPRPAQEIAQAHGKPGIAGWTTPDYDITPLQVSSHRLDLRVTLGFTMELAKEYKGATLQVLRDHEFGHVTIGRNKAQTHLIDELKQSLLTLPNFANLAQIRQKFAFAVTQFVDTEETSSTAYDQIDYPRMQQAYLGAKLKLADLMADAPTIGQLVLTLRQLQVNGWFATDQQLVGLAQDVLTAYDGLSEEEIARLQYNSEFHALLDRCRSQLAALSSYKHNQPALTLMSLGDAITAKLQEVLLILDSFVWKPPV